MYRVTMNAYPQEDLSVIEEKASPYGVHEGETPTPEDIPHVFFLGEAFREGAGLWTREQGFLQSLEEDRWKYLLMENREGYALTEDIFIQPVSSSYITREYYRHVVYIDPNHAFGDGRHPTTLLCMGFLVERITPLSEVERGRLAVMDVGAGTGILSILAMKLGAGSVEAVEISESALASAKENARTNRCEEIRFRQGDIACLEGSKCYDIVLANLISDVIIPNLASLCRLVRPGGVMVMSGVSRVRAPEVQRHLAESPLRLLDRRERDGWCGYLLLLPD